MAGDEFLGLEFDTLDLDEAIAWVVKRGADAPFAYVVTPNVDHMVRYRHLDAGLQRAYTDADLCLCDSRILQKLARTAGVDLTLVPGSDLTARLIGGALPAGTHVLLIGGSGEHLAMLRGRYPALRFSQHIPPMGLIRDAAARRAVIDATAVTNATIMLLAVGAPQQELLALEMRESGQVAGTTLCIGASVNFLVGQETRAPKILQTLSLEWAWRLLQDPRRLARRYLIDDPAIFAMTWKWARTRKNRR
jgi:N-acetylglucosaminyldiphosphoundecaprenol N-acetyl-beta-D-mannosaminyltransferase